MSLFKRDNNEKKHNKVKKEKNRKRKGGEHYAYG